MPLIDFAPGHHHVCMYMHIYVYIYVYIYKVSKTKNLQSVREIDRERLRTRNKESVKMHFAVFVVHLAGR